MMRLVSTMMIALLLSQGSAFAGTREEPEAADECGVDELTETHDLTLHDPPWVDLCAIWLDASVDDEDTVESLTVTFQVAGMLQERTPTGAWSARLAEGDCRHNVAVADDGGIGEARVWAQTQCGMIPNECGEPWPTINDILRELGIGSSCGAVPDWEAEETVDLPLSAAQFGDDTLTVTIAAQDMGDLMRQRIVAGTVVNPVSGTASTGVGLGDDGARSAIVDVDFADPTGRAFVVGG